MRGVAGAFEKGVSAQEQVIFATYIHNHLKEKASGCDAVAGSMSTLRHAGDESGSGDAEAGGQRGGGRKIICVKCEKYLHFGITWRGVLPASRCRKRWRCCTIRENRELDSQHKGKLLALEVVARITSTNQKCFEIPGVERNWMWRWNSPDMFIRVFGSVASRPTTSTTESLRNRRTSRRRRRRRANRRHFHGESPKTRATSRPGGGGNPRMPSKTWTIAASR